MSHSPLPESPFLMALRGSFTAALRWPQLDELWQRLRDCADANWYIYAVGEPPPIAPSSAAAVCAFIIEIDALLHREHQEDFCGIVYVDSFTTPRFIKIYDPNNLGAVCGYSKNPPLPGWIISQLAPIDLPATITKQRQRWWQRWLTQFN